MNRSLTLLLSMTLVVTLQSLCLASPTTQAAPAPKSTMSGNAERSPSPAQASVASKKSFSSEPASKAAKAISAADLEKALTLVGKKGSFQGTVSAVYTPESNGLVILDFADDYKTALTAVLFAKDYKKFPNMQTLKGQSVVVNGQFKAYEGKAEIELTDPKQISILK